MKHKARQQKTAVETIEARKIKVVRARKEEKDTVSWKHEPPSPSLWNNPRPGPLPITRGTALCLPVHFWHRGTPSTSWSGVRSHRWGKRDLLPSIVRHGHLPFLPSVAGRLPGGWSRGVPRAFLNSRGAAAIRQCILTEKMCFFLLL